MTQPTLGNKTSPIFNGPVAGQVVIGDANTVIQTISASRAEVAPEDLARLSRMFAELKARVEAEAPAEKKGAALERLGELEEAVVAPKPNLSTMEYVRDWFVKHLPALAGAVTGLVVNPIVGKLVEVAGDALAAEFRRRFPA
jgi:hypothetical protein